MTGTQLVRTSNRDWLKAVATRYKSGTNFLLVDDANLGIDPQKQTIRSMAVTAKVGWNEWVQLAGSLGIGVVGIGLIAAAIADPEPTSKLGLIVATGGVLAVGGGFTGLWVLTGVKPASVGVNADGTFSVCF